MTQPKRIEKIIPDPETQRFVDEFDQLLEQRQQRLANWNVGLKYCSRETCAKCPKCQSPSEITNTHVDIRAMQQTYPSLPDWPVGSRVEHQCGTCTQVWGHLITVSEEQGRFAQAVFDTYPDGGVTTPEP